MTIEAYHLCGTWYSFSVSIAIFSVSQAYTLCLFLRILVVFGLYPSAQVIFIYIC